MFGTLKEFFVTSRPWKWLNYQIRLLKVGVLRGNPLFVGIGATKLFLAFIVLLALLPNKTETGWSLRAWSFLTAPPNEIGDTLAGIAGALAFLWIIVTVLMQSKELAAQREELRLTRDEFEKMSSAQEKQASILEKQGEILAKEQRQRTQAEFKNLLDQELLAFWLLSTTFPLVFISWTLPSEAFDDSEWPEDVTLFSLPDLEVSSTSESYRTELQRDHEIRLQARHLVELIDSLSTCESFFSEESLPDFPRELTELASCIQRISVIKENLSHAQRKRVMNLKLEEISVSLDRIVSTPQWWRNPGDLA